jgi:Peptidase propeptide and YPEB domain
VVYVLFTSKNGGTLEKDFSMRKVVSALLIGLAMSSTAIASDDDSNPSKIDDIRTENIGEISCDAARSDVLLPLSAIKARGTVYGYRIGRVEEKAGCLEAYAIDKNSMSVKLYMHPVTGVILRKKFDN